MKVLAKVLKVESFGVQRGITVARHHKLRRSIFVLALCFFCVITLRIVLSKQLELARKGRPSDLAY